LERFYSVRPSTHPQTLSGSFVGYLLFAGVEHESSTRLLPEKTESTHCVEDDLPRICRGSFATGTKKPTEAIASVGLAGQDTCIGCAPLSASGLDPFAVSLATEPDYRYDADHWRPIGGCSLSMERHHER
jgi:hypothetical protein